MVLYATQPNTLSPADPCNKVAARDNFRSICIRRPTEIWAMVGALELVEALIQGRGRW